MRANQYDYCYRGGMQYITGQNRHQSYFSTLEAQVSPDNPVRLIDAFIDKLDLEKTGFSKGGHKSEGRPPYAPGVLLKLYLYGYLNKIRSSRKLQAIQNWQPDYAKVVCALKKAIIKVIYGRNKRSGFLPISVMPVFKVE